MVANNENQETIHRFFKAVQDTIDKGRNQFILFGDKQADEFYLTWAKEGFLKENEKAGYILLTKAESLIMKLREANYNKIYFMDSLKFVKYNTITKKGLI